jgi:hypothetical protein
MGAHTKAETPSRVSAFTEKVVGKAFVREWISSGDNWHADGWDGEEIFKGTRRGTGGG